MTKTLYDPLDPLMMNPANALAAMKQREYGVMVARVRVRKRSNRPASVAVRVAIEIILGLNGGRDVSTMTHVVY